MSMYLTCEGNPCLNLLSRMKLNKTTATKKKQKRIRER